jgi:hypothetical protein
MIFMRQRRYRIYLGYYDGSNLHSAMTHHFNQQTDPPPPEMIVWYIAKALASACLVLQQGITADEASAAWKPITHLDIHLGNKFLDFNKRKREDSDSESDESGSGSEDSESENDESEERRGKRQKTAANTTTLLFSLEISSNCRTGTSTNSQD